MIIICLVFFNTKSYSNITSNELYEKIDLFGEVLEKIKQEYVDEIDQADVMDSAINGVLQSLDPYSAYMSPDLFKSMQTESSGEFGGLGIEIGMEAGVVKVIAPISDTPAEKAGIKNGDVIVELAGRRITHAYHYTYAADSLKIGKEAGIVVNRGGKQISFRILPIAKK